METSRLQLFYSASNSKKGSYSVVSNVPSENFPGLTACVVNSQPRRCGPLGEVGANLGKFGPKESFWTHTVRFACHYYTVVSTLVSEVTWLCSEPESHGSPDLGFVRMGYNQGRSIISCKSHLVSPYSDKQTKKTTIITFRSGYIAPL